MLATLSQQQVLDADLAQLLLEPPLQLLLARRSRLLGAARGSAALRLLLAQRAIDALTGTGRRRARRWPRSPPPRSR